MQLWPGTFTAVRVNHPVFFVTALAAGMLTACSSSPKLTGRGGFEVLGSGDTGIVPSPSANSADVRQSPDERIEFIPARALAPLAQPAYPAEALAAGAGSYVLVVTAVVDENGRMTDVAPSWRHVQLRQAWSGAFLKSAQAALAEWKLSPAHEVYYRRTADGQEVYDRTETVAQTVEIKFTFEATGVVR